MNDKNNDKEINNENANKIIKNLSISTYNNNEDDKKRNKSHDGRKNSYKMNIKLQKNNSRETYKDLLNRNTNNNKFLNI